MLGFFSESFTSTGNTFFFNICVSTLVGFLLLFFGDDLPERGKINMAVNVFGINIQSADTKLPQQEATYKTMTNKDHTLKIEPTGKKTKQSMMNKTKHVPLGRSKLHPDYIIHGSVKINLLPCLFYLVLVSHHI
jgi:hypothetical protein